ncbi:hypothetical protein Rhopal_002877-T1 [Rhodotorula paludigena]|uniref:PAS domain-containing protein n=1 Tax=Rhodotorula paludigena TaxID=86838 RepID=A0AAV5GMI1_9BASI|nr:hypothetical protein Rhopal_002877-T1 [Rhodotorula paludigena]
MDQSQYASHGQYQGPGTATEPYKGRTNGVMEASSLSGSGSAGSQIRPAFPYVDSGHVGSDTSTYETHKSGQLDQRAPPPENLPASSLPFLPNVAPLRAKDPSAGKGTTSRPFNLPLSNVQSSLSYSLSRLLSLPRFAAYLATPLGYAQFSAYLSSFSSQSEALAQLELWKDTLVLSQLTKQAGFGSKGMFQVYLSEGAKPKVNLPDSTLYELVEALRKTRMGSPGLDSTSKHLLQTLYANEFERFVKARLLAHTKTQLGKYSLRVEDRGGIGSAFLLTNPRLRDDPIVLVSPGFEQLTGYSAQQIVGRNCRFLQGKATSPEAVDNIRKRLEAADEVLQLVLNYRADGSPFLNLLHVLPLRDLDGNLAYFLGGQTDMTRALTTGTDLSLMLPAEEDVLGVDMTAFTPAVQLEARECAFKPAPPLGTFHGVDIPPPDEVLGHEHGGAQEHGGTQGSKKEQRGKMSVHGLFGLLTKPGKGSVKKMSKRKKKAAEFVGGDAQQDGGAVTAEAGPHDQQQEPPQDEGKQRQEQQGKDPLVAPTQHETATMPLEKRLLDVQVTYERLAIVKRQTREIIYTTSGFLRTAGLAGTTREEIDRSPLIYQDLVELLVAHNAPSPTSAATKDIRAKVKQAFADAVGAQIECAIRFKKEGSSAFSGTTPLAIGRLHLAPLLDMMGECIALTAVFG